MLQFLPDSLILWFCNILLLLGLVLTVLGFFVHKIPFLYQYQLPFKVVGIALLVAGVYFRGGYEIEMTWRERVSKLENDLQAAQQESAKVNVVFRDKVVYRDKIIREQGQTLVEYVDREVVRTITPECNNLPMELIEVHNRAAKLNEVVQQLESKTK
jgi:hypothetical protein